MATGRPLQPLSSAELEQRAIGAYGAGAGGAADLREISEELALRRDVVAVTLLPLVRQWLAEADSLSASDAPADAGGWPARGWGWGRARRRAEADPEAAALREALARKTEECERLARDLAEARAQPRDAVRTSVHLSDGAPDWAVAAMRKAFRARYHPDRWRTPTEKAAAERVFKAAEAAFERIGKAG